MFKARQTLFSKAFELIKTTILDNFRGPDQTQILNILISDATTVYQTIDLEPHFYNIYHIFAFFKDPEAIRVLEIEMAFTRSVSVSLKSPKMRQMLKK